MRSIDQPSVKRQLLHRISLLHPNLMPRWGKMNAPQMLAHLNDSFISVMGDKLVPIDPNFRFRAIVKWFALYMPTHWPHDVPTVPEIDQQRHGTPPGDFEADRQMLLAAVERFTRLPREFIFRPHPMFLELTERQWMRWGWLHTDHHLRQFGL